MQTTIFGWLAVIALIALPCAHPIRATSFGPRLIAILAFVGLFSFGLYIALSTIDLYLLGEAPIFTPDGGTIGIATYPELAYFFIALTTMGPRWVNLLQRTPK